LTNYALARKGATTINMMTLSRMTHGGHMTNATFFYCYTECRSAELSVVMLIVITLSVFMLRDITMNGITLSVITLSVITLSVITQSVMLSVITLSVMLSVIMPCVMMLSAVAPSEVNLNVI
jgi:hypothetical protein